MAPVASLRIADQCGAGGRVSLPKIAGLRAPVTLGILPGNPRSIW
jgi:hypothetical protein